MKIFVHFVGRCILGSVVGAGAMVVFGPASNVAMNAAIGALIGLPLFLAVPPARGAHENGKRSEA